MKVVTVATRNTVELLTLKSGDMFKYASDYYMKVDKSEYDSTIRLYNVVRLKDGILMEFNDCEMVLPVDGRVVIEEG